MHVIGSFGTGGGIGRRVYLKVMTNAADQEEKQYPALVTEYRTRQANEQIRQLTGFGYASPAEEGAPVGNVNRRVLYSQTVTPVIRSMKTKVSKQALYTDQYGEVRRMFEYMGMSFAATRERAVADMYNNGFSSSYLGPDAVSLFSTAHATNGGPTYSNRASTATALSEITLATALQTFRAIKDPNNITLRQSGKVKLVVPPGLEFKALKIEQSVMTPGNADNDKNVVASRIKVHVLDELTSSTAWYFQLEDKRKHSLSLLYRMPMFMKETEDDQGDTTYYAMEEYVPFWSHGYGVYGNEGA